MPTLRFAANGSKVYFNLPAAANFTGNLSLAVLIRRRAIGAWHAQLNHGPASLSATPQPNLEIDSANHPEYDVGTGTTAATTLTDITNWYILALTKTAGSTLPRFHLKRIDDASAWIHQDGAANVNNPASQTGWVIVYGIWQSSDQSDQNMAVGGGWAATLTDLQVEALNTNKATTDWTGHAVAPAYVHELTKQSGIADLMGNGATFNSITGTSVDTLSDPPGWTFIDSGAAAPPPRPIPASFVLNRARLYVPQHALQQGSRLYVANRRAGVAGPANLSATSAAVAAANAALTAAPKLSSTSAAAAGGSAALTAAPKLTATSAASAGSVASLTAPAKMTATSAAAAGSSVTFRSGAAPLYDEVMADGPIGYWRQLHGAFHAQSVADDSGSGHPLEVYDPLAGGGAHLGVDDAPSLIPTEPVDPAMSFLPGNNLWNPAHYGVFNDATIRATVTMDCWVSMRDRDPQGLGANAIDIFRNRNWGLVVRDRKITGVVVLAGITIYSTDSGGRAGSFTPLTVIEEDTTYHVVFQWEAARSEMRVYVNGVLDSLWRHPTTDGLSIDAGSWNSICVGTNENAVNGPDGVVDEPALYNYLLSPARIRTHYRAGVGPSAYETAVRADNPDGYWPLTDLSDVSGYGRDLTDVNPSGAVSDVASLIAGGPSNGAKHLAGSQTTGFSRADDAGLSPSPDMTMEVWIKPGAPTGTSTMKVMNKGGHKIGMRATGKVYWEVVTPGGTTWLDGTTTLVAGSLYHVVGVADSGTYHLYINGVEEPGSFSFDSSIVDNASPLLVGGESSDVTFTGDVDEVAFYGTALSGARVLAHYTAGAPAGGANLSSTSAAAAGGSAGLTASVRLSSTSAAAAASTAPLTAPPKMTATSAAAAASAAGLTAPSLMAATSAAAAGGTATLGTVPKLASASAALAGGTAALTAAPKLGSTSAALASSTAALTAPPLLGSTSAALAGGTAALTASPRLAATSAAAAATSANLTVPGPALLVGTSAAAAGGTAGLTAAPKLAATSAAAGAGSAGLTATPRLSATAPAVAGGSALLTAAPQLSAASAAAAGASATLITAAALTAASAAAASSTAPLRAPPVLASVSAAAAFSAVTLMTAVKLTAVSAGAASSTSLMTAAAQLASVSAAAAESVINLQTGTLTFEAVPAGYVEESDAGRFEGSGPGIVER